jgi:hypothetical protein
VTVGLGSMATWGRMRAVALSLRRRLSAALEDSAREWQTVAERGAKAGGGFAKKISENASSRGTVRWIRMVWRCMWGWRKTGVAVEVLADGDRAPLSGVG